MEHFECKHVAMIAKSPKNYHFNYVNHANLKIQLYQLLFMATQTNITFVTMISTRCKSLLPSYQKVNKFA